MKRLIVFTIFLPLIGYAQQLSSVSNINKAQGIDWVAGLTWKEVKEKAKKENKYIFIDAFATWCKPCKKMDKETFPQPEVVDILNNNFISVKVQMDKTKSDAAWVQTWYDDAAMVKKQYHVRSFPTYVFLSPQGEVSHLITGFKDVTEFVKETNIALQPGRKYSDPNEEYFILLDEYNQGKKNYKTMPLLFKKAQEMKDANVLKAVSKDYREYLKNVREKKWYTKDNIEFLTAHALTSTSPFYKMFFLKGKRVDKIMGQNGYSQSFIDQIIKREIAEPFLGKKFGGARMIGGKENLIEADWDGLYEAIKTKYNDDYAKRNLLEAQILWYETHFNRKKLVESLFLALAEYHIDPISTEGPRSIKRINSNLWKVFLSVNDTSILQLATRWMEQAVKICPENVFQFALCADTYANLLYKTKRLPEAIYWEERAIQTAKELKNDYLVKNYEVVISKMKQGVPTW